MSVAADVEILKKRIDHYLWRSSPKPAAILRGLLSEHFGQFDRIAIIGGLVRDLARVGTMGFKSDIDLVIDAPYQLVAELAQKISAIPNRFGGYAYHHPQWKIDFWSLETTWAATNGHVHVRRLGDLVDCTFFDWDAALYDLRARKVICKGDYLDTIRRNQMDINLLHTPSIEGNLLRAVRRLLMWNLSAGPKLRKFIDENLTTDRFERMAATERTLYASAVLCKVRNVDGLFSYLYDFEARAKLNTSFGSQLVLPGVEMDPGRINHSSFKERLHD